MKIRQLEDWCNRWCLQFSFGALKFSPAAFHLSEKSELHNSHVECNVPW